MTEGNKDNKGDEKDKRVKIQVEGEDELGGEGETGRRKMKRFQLPNLPRWWQAKIIQYAFAHPHVRARLEKHMGSNLVRLTDKSYMTELEERIRVVNEENLNKRISSRVLDEMERLKRLILVGKTPLKECPPELYHHPVFVFWRMVNREVARATKKRADAYYRKLKASQKIDQGIDEEAEAEAVSEEGQQLTPEQLLAKCVAELEEIKQADIEKGVRFSDDQFAVLKYEANEIKILKNLTKFPNLQGLGVQYHAASGLRSWDPKFHDVPNLCLVPKIILHQPQFQNRYSLGVPYPTSSELRSWDLESKHEVVAWLASFHLRLHHHLQTVEELYALADKIIGTKRL